MRVIYEPKGRAREYSPLALNLYDGCGHGCVYCYAPSCVFKTPNQFHFKPQPRKDVIEKLRKDAKELQGDERQILMCFTSDPYQPIDKLHQLTRQAIEILIENGLRFTILTKGGTRAVRDFDLLRHYECSFGSTILLTSERTRKVWEPGTATLEDRIKTIKQAKKLRIRTEVSLEPVLFTQQALSLIENINEFVDFWKVGKLNHANDLIKQGYSNLYEQVKDIDWAQFYYDVTGLLDNLDADYYIKNDLKAYSDKEVI